MYIKERFEEMKKFNDEKTNWVLETQLERLTSQDFMGQIYKFYFFGDDLSYPFDQALTEKI